MMAIHGIGEKILLLDNGMCKGNENSFIGT